MIRRVVDNLFYLIAFWVAVPLAFWQIAFIFPDGLGFARIVGLLVVYIVNFAVIVGLWHLIGPRRSPKIK